MGRWFCRRVPLRLSARMQMRSLKEPGGMTGRSMIQELDAGRGGTEADALSRSWPSPTHSARRGCSDLERLPGSAEAL